MSQLYDVLLEKMNGKSYDSYFMACCPFLHDGHKETHPSLQVHDDGRFNCLTCHKTGTLKFLAKVISHDTLSIGKQTPIVLPRWRKWEDKYGDISEIAHHAHQSLKRFPQFQAYFKKRKIAQFIEQGRFGYMDGWCLFPILDPHGKVIDIVVRSAGNKKETRYVLHPDKDRESPYIYCPDWKRVELSDIVYVPFGIIDAWAFYSIGYPCITGTSGTSFNLERLKELHKHLIFIPDKGEEDDARELSNQLGWDADTFIIDWPDGCKDSDDIRRIYGDEALSKLIIPF
jgi:DNA primase